MNKVYKQSIARTSTLRVTAGYPRYPDGSPHGGIDVVIPDRRVYAPDGGRVITAHVWQGGTSGPDSWGNYIVVETSPNQYWLAAHFKRQIWKVGDAIGIGSYIGEQGRSGNTTGIHTHFERWAGGYGTNYRADPSTLLRVPNAVGVYSIEWDVKIRRLPAWLIVWLGRRRGVIY